MIQIFALEVSNAKKTFTKGFTMAADRKQIEAKVIEIIADQLARDKEQISGASDIANDLGADSLDLAELMIAFEENFDIDIDEDKVGEISTVNDAVDQICKVLDSNE